MVAARGMGFVASLLANAPRPNPPLTVTQTQYTPPPADAFTPQTLTPPEGSPTDGLDADPNIPPTGDGVPE